MRKFNFPWIKNQKCDHKYKDFLWKIDAYLYSDNLGKFVITAPYVCVRCKDRKDVVLDEFYKEAKSFNELASLKNELLEEYGEKVKDTISLEKEINDFILVDKEYKRP